MLNENIPAPVGPRGAIDNFYAEQDARNLGVFGDLIKSTSARIKAARSNTIPREASDWALFHDEF